MKKISVLLMAIMVLCLCGCGNSNPIKDVDSCDLIYIIDGSNGDLYYVTEKEIDFESNSSETTMSYGGDDNYFMDMKEFVKELELEYVSGVDSTGWMYSVTFVEGDEDIQKITFVNSEICIINDKKYKINEECREKVEELYNRISNIEIIIFKD